MRWLRTLSYCGVLCGLFLSAGGHWYLAQIAAWTSMVVEYSQEEGSLCAGLAKTFSGQAPCSFCKKIQTQKQKEDRQDLLKLDAKEQLLSKALRAPAPRPNPVAISWVRHHEQARIRKLEPLLEPPRA